MASTTVRKGMPSVELSREEFSRRFRRRFYDPAFDGSEREIATLEAIAWDGYSNSRKSPRTQAAGPGYADPSYQLSVEWIETRGQILVEQDRQKNPASPARILLINGSSRSDQTCPGEMSKSFRFARIAEEIFKENAGVEIDVLDLSTVTSEYGRVIYPCKACVSTAMPLCHWPCSCYPNHSLGQVNDWMAELYPRWMAAHGVMIICPVNWFAAPSSPKLMIDRLVCADGGNPDPSSTHGKKPEEAKALELAGWPYPRHLAGRVFAVTVHGDIEGADDARRALTEWLTSMGLIAAGHLSEVGGYIGYSEPYATSHDALDADLAIQEDVRNAARALVRGVAQMRAGDLKQPDAGLKEPKPK